jgi:subtilisin
MSFVTRFSRTPLRTRFVNPWIAVTLAAGAVAGVLGTPGSLGAEPPALPGSYIIRFQPTTSVEATAVATARQAWVRPRYVFTHTLNGMAADLSAAQVRALRHDPRVAELVPDQRLELEPTVLQAIWGEDGRTLAAAPGSEEAARAVWDIPRSVGTLTPFAVSNGFRAPNAKSAPAPPPQVIPTGVRRIGGTTSHTAKIDGKDTPLDVDVAVLDTGIDAGHPDLNVVGGFSVFGDGYGVDPNGHGTHVAGIIGARDNKIGVVGVAPGARLWDIRCLDANGVGKWSDVIAGLEYVTQHADVIDVLNISMGGASTNDALLHAAIDACTRAGVTVVCAAGNNAAPVNTMIPARYDSVICVSALADFNGKPGASSGSVKVTSQYVDVDETFANFSNYGPEVSLIAPGVTILSTWKGGGYALMAGTSQATPHVAGAAALFRATHRDASPAVVKAALIASGRAFSPRDDPDHIHELSLDVSHL